MTHRWNQTIVINERIARECVEQQHNICVESIEKLEEGWDNIAYLINGSLLFRFPRREPGLDCMSNEIALLPFIAKNISFPISAPQWIGRPSDIYPYAYAGYPLLRGISITEATDTLINDNKIAETLASWIRELHQIPVTKEHEALLTSTSDWQLDFQHRGTRFIEHLPQYRPHFENAGFDTHQLLDICSELREWKFTKERRCFIHGDLYHRHILVDSRDLKPTGIIDWGDLQIGQPGIDLVTAFVFSPSSYEHFFNAYGNIDEETKRAFLFKAFFAFTSFLPYAFERNVPSFTHWSVMSLRRVLEVMDF